MPRSAPQESRSACTPEGAFPEAGASTSSSGARPPAVFWLASCAVHALLFLVLSLTLRDVADSPLTPPIRVTVVAGGEPLAPSATPERSTPPIEAASPPATAVEMVPEMESGHAAPAVIEPPRAAPSARPPSESATAQPSVVPAPPVIAQAPVPPVPQTLPSRHVPYRPRPTTTFEDALAPRILSPEPQRTGPPQASTAAPPAADATNLPPKMPRIAGARYGHNPAPAYPSEARRRGWEGTVLLLVEILENGRPERVTVQQSSGYRTLDEAARGAVSRWTFIPAQRDGRPIRSLVEVPIVFSLRREP
jgi:protein TonB